MIQQEHLGVLLHHGLLLEDQGVDGGAKCFEFILQISNVVAVIGQLGLAEQGDDQGGGAEDGGYDPGGLFGLGRLGDHAADQLQLVIGEAGGRFCGGLFLHAQEPPQGHAEEFAHGNELVDLRHGAVGFPFGNGLPGHAHLVAQGFLGKAQLFPLGGNALA